MMYPFCIVCAFYYAVTISGEYFNKMSNDVLDKIIYQLMIKDSFWQDLNLCSYFYDVTDYYIFKQWLFPKMTEEIKILLPVPDHPPIENNAK